MEVVVEEVGGVVSYAVGNLVRLATEVVGEGGKVGGGEVRLGHRKSLPLVRGRVKLGVALKPNLVCGARRRLRGCSGGARGQPQRHRRKSRKRSR